MLAVEQERLAREATDHHTNATAETKRLVEEAEERAAAAEQRARDATPRPPSTGPRPRPRPSALLARARREAEQIVAAANTQAESITASGHAELERQVAALRSEVDRLIKRRDAITAQLASLRDVVAGFGDDDDVRLERPRDDDPAEPQRARRSRGAEDEPSRRRPAVRTTSASQARRWTAGHRSSSASSVRSAPCLPSGWRTHIAGHRLDPGAHRRRVVPGRRPQPVGRVLRAPRVPPHVRRDRRDRRGRSSRSRSSSSRSCRSSPTRSPRSPTAHRSGSTSCSGTRRPGHRRRVRRHREGPGLRHRRRLRRHPLRRRDRRRPGRARRAVQRLHHPRPDALLPVLAGDHEVSALPAGPGLAPRPGQPRSATGSSRASAATSPARSWSPCAPGITLADLPVRHRARRVRRRAGVRRRDPRRHPDDRRHDRRGDRHARSRSQRTRRSASPA